MRDEIARLAKALEPDFAAPEKTRSLQQR